MNARDDFTPVRVGGIAGLVLAGGEGRRMGAGLPKPLRLLQGRPMIAHVIERIRPQVMQLAISSSDAESYRGFGLPILADPVLPLLEGETRVGPLAAVLAGLEWTTQQHVHCRWLLTVPADTPFLPRNLMVRMAGFLHVDEPEILALRYGARLHPTISVWSVRLIPDLRRALAEEGLRKVERFIDRHAHKVLGWPRGGPDPFFNVNTPQDLARAARRAAG